jgi:hypothetical protein
MNKWNCKFSIRPIHLIFNEMNDKNVGLSIDQINSVIQYCNNYLLINKINLSSLMLQNIKDMLSSFSEYKNMVSVSKIPKPCYTGFRLINIWSNGDVSQCTYSHFNLGNIKKNSFEDIWKSNLMKSKIAEAALMGENIDAPYLHCISCSEPEGRSAKIKNTLDKIPFSNALLYRSHKKNTSLMSSNRIIKIHSK